MKSRAVTGSISRRRLSLRVAVDPGEQPPRAVLLFRVWRGEAARDSEALLLERGEAAHDQGLAQPRRLAERRHGGWPAALQVPAQQQSDRRVLIGRLSRRRRQVRRHGGPRSVARLDERAGEQGRDLGAAVRRRPIARRPAR